MYPGGQPTWVLLSVREHVLLEVVLPDERPVTEFAVHLLGSRVDHHVRRHVGLLGEGLLTHRTPVVLLTWEEVHHSNHHVQCV